MAGALNFKLRKFRREPRLLKFSAFHAEYSLTRMHDEGFDNSVRVFAIELYANHGLIDLPDLDSASEGEVSPGLRAIVMQMREDFGAGEFGRVLFEYLRVWHTEWMSRAVSSVLALHGARTTDELGVTDLEVREFEGMLLLSTLSVDLLAERSPILASTKVPLQPLVDDAREIAISTLEARALTLPEREAEALRAMAAVVREGVLR